MKLAACWLLHPLITLDRLINWLSGGSFNETLSARAHRLRLAGKPKMERAINTLFFWQYNHCLHSYNYWHPKLKPSTKCEDDCKVGNG